MNTEKVTVFSFNRRQEQNMKLHKWDVLYTQLDINRTYSSACWLVN